MEIPRGEQPGDDHFCTPLQKYVFHSGMLRVVQKCCADSHGCHQGQSLRHSPASDAVAGEDRTYLASVPPDDDPHQGPAGQRRPADLASLEAQAVFSQLGTSACPAVVVRPSPVALIRTLRCSLLREEKGSVPFMTRSPAATLLASFSRSSSRRRSREASMVAWVASISRWDGWSEFWSSSMMIAQRISCSFEWKSACAIITRGPEVSSEVSWCSGHGWWEA